MAGLAVALALGGSAWGQKLAQIERIEASHTSGKTRITISVAGAIDIASQRIENPARIFVDFQRAVPALRAKSDGAFDRTPQTIAVKDPYVRQVRVAENQRGVTRVVLDLTRDDVDYQTSTLAGNRLVVELSLSKNKVANPLAAPDPKLISQALPSASMAAKPAKVPSPLTGTLSAKRPPNFRMPEPPELSLSVRLPKAEPNAVPYKISGFVLRDFRPVKPASTPVGKQAAVANSAAAAVATSNGKRSLTRVLGLKIGRVVIDAGHGGHDAGTTGPSGLTEKEVTLDVAKRLGELITENLGSEVVFTRNDDRYIALEERGAIANRSRADLFISIHANSSRHSTATGVETYYLNFTSSPEALEVAARENAVSERSVNDLGDLIKKIALKDKIDESREFAGKVQMALYSGAAKAGNRTKDRGVRKAPFVVLIGASMPSILTEIGFLSNPKEESLLKKPEYRQKIAEALYRGISQYAGGLSHFNVAQTGTLSSLPE